jgi:hypothetical protein
VELALVGEAHGLRGVRDEGAAPEQLLRARDPEVGQVFVRGQPDLGAESAHQVERVERGVLREVVEGDSRTSASCMANASRVARSPGAKPDGAWPTPRGFRPPEPDLATIVGRRHELTVSQALVRAWAILAPRRACPSQSLHFDGAAVRVVARVVGRVAPGARSPAHDLPARQEGAGAALVRRDVYRGRNPRHRHRR